MQQLEIYGFVFREIQVSYKKSLGKAINTNRYIYEVTTLLGENCTWNSDLSDEYLVATSRFTKKIKDKNLLNLRQ